jgi:dolichol-phosphate mannosyltransferase
VPNGSAFSKTHATEEKAGLVVSQNEYILDGNHPHNVATMQISVIVPVYNEVKWLPQVLARIEAANFAGLTAEIIIVDDASVDGSADCIAQQLTALKAANTKKNWQLVQHTHNQGKGQAIKTALQHCSGQFIIINDADLEYDPTEFDTILPPLIQQQSLAVFGSRLHPDIIAINREGFNTLFYIGNRLLTWVTNLLYATKLTDMETCYKAFDANLLKTLPLKANGFDIEPEITALLAKRGVSIQEVPIHYKGRNSKEGKKIGWRDAYMALMTLTKHKLTNVK